MRDTDVSAIVESQLVAFQPPEVSGTIGVPWSSERWASEISKLRAALILPRLAPVDICDGPARGRRLLWVVTRPVENSYVVVFDADSNTFGLAVAGPTSIETVGVWGDLPSAFAAH
jgi:hypothetical protein